MSDALEQLVRPFQSPNTVGRRRIVSTRTTITPEPVRVCWGEAGDMPVAIEVPAGEDPGGFAFEVKKRARHDLTARETEKVKVTNPDDENQYVIVERIKKATFKEQNVDPVAAYPKSGFSNATQTTAGSTPPAGWQPAETSANSDGTGPAQQTYPLKIEERDYHIDWPQGENEEILT